MAKLVIFGAGVIARMAHHYFTRDSEHEVVAFTVDEKYRPGDTFLELPLVPLEGIKERYAPAEYKMFVGLGYARMNKAREEKYHQMKALGYKLVSYVSSRCSFLTDHPVGDNCFILEDNTIQPFVKIGNNVTLWSGNHIGHDSVIEDHAFLTSHVVVSGHVRVGAYSFIGVNATLRNSITLAPATLVGAGAVVMKDTIEKGVYLPRRSELFSKRSDEIEL